mmetsp:Transcript_36840/g.86023  ORF Transcript_36840/g.86023 Transcript_36840/m.86023 type:complete len:89 (+) Transcript_36840:2392-2658(+)
MSIKQSIFFVWLKREDSAKASANMFTYMFKMDNLVKRQMQTQSTVFQCKKKFFLPTQLYSQSLFTLRNVENTQSSLVSFPVILKAFQN